MFKELNRVKVFSAAIDVRQPLTVALAVVKVEHRSYRVNTETVDVEFIKPEKSAGDKEVANLVALIVKDKCTPVGMFAASRVGMLVQACAVEASESMAVLGEVSGYPVKEYSDTLFVHIVDKVHKVLGSAET